VKKKDQQRPEGGQYAADSERGQSTLDNQGIFRTVDQEAQRQQVLNAGEMPDMVKRKERGEKNETFLV